ncbi:MAG: SDR family NAD(P)-dependent oxidoreductase [Hyphomicrobiales bacterium]
MANLNGKVALVTGSSRGIGAEVVRQLAAKGASVFLTSNEEQQVLDEAAAKLTRDIAGAQVAAGSFDLCEEKDMKALVAACLKRFGTIDILVNNAAIRIRKPFGEFSADDFDQVIAVNLRAPFLLGQEVANLMKSKNGGRIINIASQMASIAEQNLTIYGLSKAALVHLGMSMAFELAPHGIMVNTVSPGPTMTEYNVERTTAHPEYKEHKLRYLRSGRYCEPREIAEVVTFLATTSATNIQGHNLIVDGGYVIH